MSSATRLARLLVSQPGWPASQPMVTVAVASLLRDSPVSTMAAARSWILPLPSSTSSILVSSPPVFTATLSRCRLNAGSRVSPCGTSTKMVPVTSIARACTRTPLRALILPAMLTAPSVLICSGVRVPAIRRFSPPPASRMSPITLLVGVATVSEPTFNTPLFPTTMPIGSTKNTRPPTLLVLSSTLFKVPSM